MQVPATNLTAADVAQLASLDLVRSVLSHATVEISRRDCLENCHSLPVMRFLIASGADTSCVLSACKKGDIAQVKLMLAAGCDVNKDYPREANCQLDSGCPCPLHTAIDELNVELQVCI